MDLLDEARRVLDEGEICDHCLGRRFALLSWGLSNDERGRSLRTVVAMEDDTEYGEVAPSGDCWVCDGVFDELDDWADRAVESAEGYDFDTYLVGTRVPPLVEENEKLLDETDGEHSQEFKSEFNREVGKRIGSALGKEVEFERPDVVFVIDIAADDVELQVNPLHIYGRYTKLERDIPQTEWPCRDCGGRGCERCDGTGYMYDESVEELVRPAVLESTEGDEMVFHGAGREDVDALMLGDGRPFVAEVKEPRVRRFDLERLQERVNESADGKVEVNGLRVVTPEMVERVKELDASKVYRMEVEISGEVSDDELDEALDGIEGEVEQRTPRRVSHRRSDRVRRRRVYEASGETNDDSTLTVEVRGEGGLYVKELVSGDEGRTEPSLAGLLGVDAEVTRLDVLAVEGDFVKEEYVKRGSV